MGERFPAAVAGGLRRHEMGVETVLHVAFQDAVSIRTVRWAESARRRAYWEPRRSNRPVVHYGDPGRDPLANAAR